MSLRQKVFGLHHSIHVDAVGPRIGDAVVKIVGNGGVQDAEILDDL